MKKKAILCVDDEKVVLNTLKEQLRRDFIEDYIIETCENGEEALDVFIELLDNGVDVPVVISDQVMPDMKGSELLYEVHKRHPLTKTILLTGQIESEEISDALKRAKLYRYIPKPWEKDDLILTIREAVNSFFKDRNITSIITLSQHISSLLNIEDLLEHIMITSVGVTGAQRGYLYMLDDKTYELEIKASQNFSSMVDIPEMSKYLVDKVYGSGEAIIILDKYSTISDNYIKYSDISSCGIKSILCMPIKRLNNVLGVCYLDTPSTEPCFKEIDVEMLRVFISQASIAIENANLYKNLEKRVAERTRELHSAYEKLNQSHNEMKKDLILAKNVQQNILPTNIDKMDSCNFIINFLPMMEVGGDIYDITVLKNDNIRIFVADATGHGVQAALVTMIIKEEYERLKHSYDKPSEVLNVLNKQFINSYENLEMYFTCIIVDIDRANQTIRYSSAGHAPQLLVGNTNINYLKPTGSIVGSIEDMTYKIAEISYEIGDKLILFTDGLFEEFDIYGEEYGEQRLYKLVFNNCNKSLSKIINRIFNDIKRFLGDVKRSDDITVIGVEFID